MANDRDKLGGVSVRAIGRDARAHRIAWLTARAAALGDSATAAMGRLGAIAKRLGLIANPGSRMGDNLHPRQERIGDKPHREKLPFKSASTSRRRARLDVTPPTSGISKLLSRLLLAAGRVSSRQFAGQHAAKLLPRLNYHPRSLHGPWSDRPASALLTPPRLRELWTAIATAVNVATGAGAGHTTASGRVIAIQSTRNAKRRRVDGSEPGRRDHTNRNVISMLADRRANGVARFRRAQLDNAASSDTRAMSHLARARERGRGWSPFLGSLASSSKLSRITRSRTPNGDKSASANRGARSASEGIRRSIAKIIHIVGPDLAKLRITLPISPIPPGTAVTPVLPQSKERTPAAARPRAIVVNYSPTLVVQGNSDVQEIEQRLLDAIGRHGHELADIIDREYAKRTRTEL